MTALSHLQHFSSCTVDPFPVFASIQTGVVPITGEPSRQEPHIVVSGCHVQLVCLAKNFSCFVGIEIPNDDFKVALL